MIRKSQELREKHIEKFQKLSYGDRLLWAFSHNQAMSRFMNSTARKINQALRRKGKKYFGS